MGFLTLDSRNEDAGRCRPEELARNLLVELDTDPRREPAAEGDLSPRGRCGVCGFIFQLLGRLPCGPRRRVQLVILVDVVTRDKSRVCLPLLSTGVLRSPGWTRTSGPPVGLQMFSHRETRRRFAGVTR